MRGESCQAQEMTKERDVKRCQGKIGQEKEVSRESGEEKEMPKKKKHAKG